MLIKHKRDQARGGRGAFNPERIDEGISRAIAQQMAANRANSRTTASKLALEYLNNAANANKMITMNLRRSKRSRILRHL